MKTRKERRAAPRFALSRDVRFLIQGKREGRGKLLNISECGLALITEATANPNEIVVAYPEGMGRIEGRIARTFEGGFCIEFSLSDAQRRSMKERIAAAVNGLPYLRIAENRSSIRVKFNVETHARIGDDKSPIPCIIVDMSKSGCRVKCKEKPQVGATVLVGSLKGIVRWRTEDGFSIEFVRSQALSAAGEHGAQGARTSSAHRRRIAQGGRLPDAKESSA